MVESCENRGKHEETAHLAQVMPPQEITVTQDETFTGGLCLVAIEPVSNYILLEQVAEARDHDTWSEAMAGALAPLKCHVIQSTSDEAPGTPGLCRTPPRRAALASETGSEPMGPDISYRREQKAPRQCQHPEGSI